MCARGGGGGGANLTLRTLNVFKLKGFKRNCGAVFFGLHLFFNFVFKFFP